MKLRLKDKEIVFEHNPSVHSIIQQINEWLGHEYYFNHLIIDGEVVSEGYEKVLSEQVNHIQEVEVVVTPARVFVNGLLVSAEEYVQRATPLLEVVAEHFYEGPTAESYYDLNDLFGGLQWLHSMLMVIEDSIARPKGWEEVQNSVEPLQEILTDFEDALENKDTVLVADLLAYEVTPIFEELAQLLTTIIDRDGERDHVN